MHKSYLTLFLCLLFGASQLKAGHESGGIIITYKNLANPLQYEIKAHAMYALGGLPPPNSMSINVQSGCYASSTVILQLQNNGGVTLTPITDADYCTSPTPMTPATGIAYYKGTVTLPGTCADFRFYVANGFGRFFNSSNIDDPFYTGYFYAKLNNMHGPNSSPAPDLGQLLQAACLNKSLQLYGNYSEADGDSIYWSASSPNYSSGGVVNNYNYKPGYSQTNQLGSSGSFSVNAQSGMVQAQLSGIGQYIVTLKYEEYRKNAAGTSVLIGESRYSRVLIGAPGCYTPAFYLHTPTQAGGDSLSCGTNKLMVKSSRKLNPFSVSANASEFKVHSALNGNIAVSGVQILDAHSMELNLSQNIAANDVLSLTADMGSDGNVIYSHCGQEIVANADTLKYYSNVVNGSVAAYSYIRSNLTVTFTASAGSALADSLYWDFGDGNGSSQTNPVHTYATAGAYAVVLSTFGECNASDTSRQTINLCDVLNASFSSTLQGDTLIVNAGSSSGVSVYHWDFGDGQSGSGASTTHYYASPGTYIITLTIYNNCQDSSSIQDSVMICADPQASWAYSIISSGGNGMQVQFDGTTSAHASIYEWDFGDNSPKGSGPTPLHTYAAPSLNYLVQLKVYNECSEAHLHAYRLFQIGLNDEAADKAQWYPNPSAGMIEYEVAAHERARVKVLDSRGAVCKILHWQGKGSSDLSALPAGAYHLSIEMNGQEYRQKLLLY